ncbi:MAG TPA: type IV pili twitching motility protein PilT [Peptococcaceae bacterium]|jgi:twitching motility protein PilT|nr:type IV pili twitching motility protein PilT [Peptococcaceae bacterium]
MDDAFNSVVYGDCDLDYPVDLQKLLILTVEQGASDLHLTAGAPPTARTYGKLIPFDLPKLSPNDVENLVFPVIDPQQRQEFVEKWELDFSYSIDGLSRFRGNIMRQRGSIAVALRVIPYQIPPIDSLNLPACITELCNLPRGLILVTGPTGSGKSTTLAAMINYINENRSLNIVTVEQPIEFLHRHKKSIVKQREVGSDTHSFGDALKHVLRHDPDVILIGEMRDVESISIALTAAETGHLVLSTLHTQTAPLAVHRIIDVFQEHMQNQVRQQLADALQGIISQQLLPHPDGQGMSMAAEVLLANSAVRNMIRDEKEYQLYTVIQTGHKQGMRTMDQALAELYREGKVSREMAFTRCVSQPELERLLGKSITSRKV